MNKFSFHDLQEVLISLPTNIKDKKLSILVPFYNEKKIIVSNIKIIADLLNQWGWNFEIIASDDGSSDGSSDLILKECSLIKELTLVRSVRNYGKGRALNTAYEASSGEYILFLDCDLELPVEHIPYFFKKMIESDADVVIGSKEDPRSNLFYPVTRKLFSFVYFLLIKILFWLPVQDTQTGIKLFKRTALENTLPYLLVKKFAFDIELLVLCFKNQCKIVSHPIILRFFRDTNVGKINFDAILHMIKDTFAVFFRLKIGFWTHLYIGKKKIRHLVIALSHNVQAYAGDIVYLDDISQISTLMPQIKEYDTIMFLTSQDEIPSFSLDILGRIFSDENIQVIYPLLYPKKEHGRSFWNYALLANIFFDVGYFPRYRPVSQNTIKNSSKYAKIPVYDLVFRREYFECLMRQNNFILPSEISELKNIIHTPYFFLHRDIPTDQSEWNQYLDKEKNLAFDLKKQARNIYYIVAVMFILGLLLKIKYLMFFLPLLELMIHCWYIFSLGIRQGVCYLLQFDQYRFYKTLDRISLLWKRSINKMNLFY